MKKIRTILPRATAGSSTGQANESSTSKVPKESTKRATMVGRACNACRKTKTKCDGARPTCKKCSERESECVYDTEEGMTRNATLIAQNQKLTIDTARLRRVLADLYQDHPTEVNRARLRHVGVSPTASAAEDPGSASSSLPTDMDYSRPASYDGRLSQYLDEDTPMVTDDSPMLYRDPASVAATAVSFSPSAVATLDSNMLAAVYEGETNVNPTPELPIGANPSLGFYNTIAPNPDAIISAASARQGQYVSPRLQAQMDSFAPGFPQEWNPHAVSHQSGPRHTGRPTPPSRLGSTKTNDEHAQRLRGGYDPNDGRISGRQIGWHFILVVRESRSIATSLTSPETRDSEYREPYHRLAPLQSGAYQPSLGTDSKTPEVNWLTQQEVSQQGRSLPKEQPTSYSTSEAAYEHNTAFSPPPGAVAGYGNLPMSSALLANGYPPSTQRRQLLTLRVAEHAIPPLLVEESSAMARMYVAFRDAGLEIIGSGTPAPLILGDPDRVVVDVLLRGRLPSDPENVDTWACQLMRTIPEMDLFVQFAWVGLLTKFMRWILNPTVDNYARVPDMIKPILSQRLIPHSPALDMCPHPGMREALMQHYRDWLTPSLLNTGSTLFCWVSSLGWPVERDPVTGEQYLASGFEEFTQNRESWSLGNDIMDIFPEAEEHNICVRPPLAEGETGIPGHQHATMNSPPPGMTSRDVDEARILEEIDALEMMAAKLRKDREIKSRMRGGGGVTMEDVERAGKKEEDDHLDGNDWKGATGRR